MVYHLGINLAWPTSHSQATGNVYFEHHIPLLQAMGFSIFRVIFTSWALNHHSVQNQQEMIQLLKYCQKRNIKLILSLHHFTDFLGLSTSEYHRHENKHRHIRIDKNSIIILLSRIFEEGLQNTIYSVELFNEIDLTATKQQKQILQKLNSLLIALKENFPLPYTISISNHLNQKQIQPKIFCPLELHTYSYPHETLLGNIKYIQKNNFLQQISEYAKYSDEYKSILSSHIYFISWLWAWALLRREVSPLSRWWEEIIKDERYKKILLLFERTFQKLPQVTYIPDGSISFIPQKSKNIITSPYSKIQTRLTNILQNIRILKHERWAIKKFLYKLFSSSPKSDFLVFRDHNNKHYILIETYTSNIIDLQQIIYTQGYSINLLTAKRNSFKSDTPISVSPWCYLFVCR